MQPTRIKTSVGMETVDETVNRAKTLLANTTPSVSSGIPGSVIANPQADLTIPEAAPVNVDAQGAVESGNAMLDQYTKQLQQQEQKAGATLSANEQAIRQAAGFLNTEGAARDQLEQSSGYNDQQKQLKDLSNGLSIATNELRTFDLNYMNQMEKSRVDAGKRDITKNTFNAGAAESNLQMSIQRAGMVANVYAQQASINVLNDNLTDAADRITKALTSIYEPVRKNLELEKMFYERNATSFDNAQNRTANARLQEIETYQATIDRAVGLSDAAVASGYASPDDIRTMTALSNDPAKQAAYAQGIVAKGARESMALERMAKNAAIAASATTRRANLMELAIAGDQQAITELGFDPGAPARAEASAELDRTLSTQIDQQNDVINRLTKAVGMTSAIKSSTGVMQNSFLSGLLPQKGVNEVPGVGSLPGGVTGGLKSMQDKAAFLSEMQYLLQGEGFKQFSALKEQGVNLTPVSELEFQKIMESANRLNSLAEFKDGKIVGFGNVNPDVIASEINTMIAGAAKVRDEKAAIKNVGYDTYLELLQLQQTNL